MIWNPDAYDYNSAKEIYDPATGKIYTEVEAQALPKGLLRSSLCVRCKVKGCWVLSSEEAKQIMLKRQNI